MLDSARTVASAARTSRTQQERRDGTRRALLDAVVESLIEVGFARTTTLEVQRRADVSRGALLHHFPSKAELLVAAVDHLAEMRAHELRRLSGQLPQGGANNRRTDAVLELIWNCFAGPFYQVAMELRAAARTDAELRPVLIAAERALRERIFAQARTLFGPDVADHPALDRALDLTLQLMIGAASTEMLHTEGRVHALIDDWKATFPTVLATLGAGTRKLTTGTPTSTKPKTKTKPNRRPR